MSRASDRLRRLERQLALARFDPIGACRVAQDCYLAGEPLPAGLDRRERELAEAMYDFLWRTEPARQFSDPRPLPLDPVVLPDRPS